LPTTLTHAAALAGGTGLRSRMPTPSPGSPAPDFTAPTDEGTVTLSALRGSRVVLYFYPKDSTPAPSKPRSSPNSTGSSQRAV
jgi:hypothetical protein